MGGKIIDQNPAPVLGHLEDFGVAWRQIHIRHAAWLRFRFFRF
jgi:hypothetical protein